MKEIYVFLLVLIIFGITEKSEAAECDNGWVNYKSNLCIQAFPALLTYNDAKFFCSEQGDAMSKCSLVTVKDQIMQDALTNYTKDIYDNMWLGGIRNEGEDHFTWHDGSPLTYTNWQQGSPRADLNSELCIEIRPQNARSTEGTLGRWLDVNCNKRNLVVCHKELPWTLQDAFSEISKIQKQLVEGSAERIELLQRLEMTNQNLETTQQNLASVSSRVVPVGSIYIEYYNQLSPRTLWPNFTWQDISSTFAGLFFRVAGSGSSGWGVTQSECSPRITQMTSARKVSNDPDYRDRYARPLNIPSNGWSEVGDAGEYWRGGGGVNFEGLKFYTQGCEVRPKNKAIRIWKRTA